ncbi:MAG: hypothetical protein WAQ24_02485 [Candidatus Saccharimonadales bacterium]
MSALLTAALFTYGIFVWYVVRQVGMWPKLSLSLHIAKSKKTIRLARGIIPIASTASVVWFLFGYAAQQDTSAFIRTLFILAGVSSSIAGVISYDHIRRNQIVHNVAAWTYAGLIGLIDLIGVTWVSNVALGRTVSVLGVAQLGLILMYLLYRPAHRYFFQLQLVYVGIFSLALLLVAYA